MLLSPAVMEPGCEEFTHLGTLLVGETGVKMVCGRVLEVYFLVGHIHVSAYHHSLLPGKAADICTEMVFPLHPVVEPAQSVLGVGGVDIDQVEVRHLKGYDPPLLVVLLILHAVADADRLQPRIYDGAGVTFLDCIVPVRTVALKLHVYLPILKFGLLQAYKIGVQGLEYLGKILPGDGSQAVDIPAYEFHKAKVSIFIRIFVGLSTINNERS